MSGRIDLAGNRGPLVNIAAWFTLVVAIIATGMKFYIKRSRIGVLQLDDLFIGISAVSHADSRGYEDILNRSRRK